ncbi:MAG: hypothetical protein A7316_01360 [Candidatus Altiarchaeales archaeon WOR_SM1_86-2]|nr:MAG: hypothetical protein A7315_05070 [Candidatus Altiarchaeales archaeon WOR_SM1_79]ODS37967.1 MAG: hypothetical protein A7316_01360 [Candidatus Altiarchaeales archaeon WOR_SM1_86-2]
MTKKNFKNLGILAIIGALLIGVVALSGCINEESSSKCPQCPQCKECTPCPTTTGETKYITLSTTTSTENSGLLKVLNAPFEKKHNIKIKVIPEGTGKALKTAELGGSDVVMVHARSSEDDFIAAGHGVNRRDLMHNDFVILGPADDPAGIKGMTNASEAFKKISESKSNFFSRGDESGTHTKEKIIWAASGVEPAGTGYKSVGKGMGDTIVMANQQTGYTLSDRGTYLSMKDEISLVVLAEGDLILYNPYGVIAVNPAKFPDKGGEYELVMLYIGYLTSPEGQKIIRDYGKEEFGEPLFFPDAVPEEVLADM